ncbi:hypothetical protein JOM56_015222 [Amanita muscaria]
MPSSQELRKQLEEYLSACKAEEDRIEAQINALVEAELEQETARKAKEAEEAQVENQRKVKQEQHNTLGGIVCDRSLLTRTSCSQHPDPANPCKWRGPEQKQAKACIPCSKKKRKCMVLLAFQDTKNPVMEHSRKMEEAFKDLRELELIEMERQHNDNLETHKILRSILEVLRNQDKGRTTTSRNTVLRSDAGNMLRKAPKRRANSGAGAERARGKEEERGKGLKGGR